MIGVLSETLHALRVPIGKNIIVLPIRYRKGQLAKLWQDYSKDYKGGPSKIFWRSKIGCMMHPSKFIQNFFDNWVKS